MDISDETAPLITLNNIAKIIYIKYIDAAVSLWYYIHRICDREEVKT